MKHKIGLKPQTNRGRQDTNSGQCRSLLLAHIVQSARDRGAADQHEQWIYLPSFRQ